ncbi:hypothetical protein Emed_002084 [Eimeria media]
MTSSRLLLVAAASAILLDSLAAASQSTDPELTLTSGNECLTDMNAARDAAGLKALTQKTMEDIFPEQYGENNIWKVVCDNVLKETAFAPADFKTAKGTYAFYNFSSETGDKCKAAVKNWQSAFKQFEESPPVSEDVDYVGMGGEALSFLALYNPQNDAQAECKVAVCKEAQKTRESGAEGSTKQGSALLCVTSPNAFSKRPVFTQDQWDKIAKAFSSSASAAAPSTLALAAVLTNVALMSLHLLTA